jgi:hypothetical protein
LNGENILETRSSRQNSTYKKKLVSAKGIPEELSYLKLSMSKSAMCGLPQISTPLNRRKLVNNNAM